TEGVFTVPFHPHSPAAPTSHVFEWIDLDSGKLSPTWELRKGQMVQPVLTGGHGLLRYKITDALEVTGQLGLTPTFTFHGRLRETDLVGEKLSPRLAMDTFDFVEKNTGAQVMSMFAVRTENKKPYYLLLARESSASPEKIKMAAEESLSKVFHYKLARELGQLDEVHVRIEKQPELFYQEIFERKGMVSGNIKVEPLSEIREELLS
ncbi:MAG: GH3 auxin-responsive promoter family protein, partial [Pseudobdellovibrionaceae bacterium]